MAIKGSLKEASLPDVLQLLAMGKKTGCLAVTHRNNFGYIYFDKGRICYASIVNRRDRLGDILVKAGSITQAQLDAAIAAQARTATSGSASCSSRRARSRAKRCTSRSSCRSRKRSTSCSPGRRGRSTSRRDVAPEEQDFLVSINPESLLLEGARRVDEWSLIEKKIPSFDLVFDVDRKQGRGERGGADARAGGRARADRRTSRRRSGDRGRRASASSTSARRSTG